MAKSRLVVVANRLPVKRVKTRGPNQWQTSPGGLVSAITPVIQDTGGTWVGWAGDEGRAPRPFEHDGYHVHPVSLNQEALDSFYYGFSNETLWPLYHDALRTPRFMRRWWWPYIEVNEIFAAAAASAMKPRDMVWVHDYQLQLVPGMIRERCPKARIGFFLHIPFPPHELFEHLPWRQQVLEGLLGADVIGFQTRRGAANFSRAARQFTSARGTDEALVYNGREIRVAAYPISIDVDAVESLAQSPGVCERHARLRSELMHGDRHVFLGVDRLDYTKGIDVRLRAYHDLLSKKKYTVRDCVMVQVAVPSREIVADYAEIRSRVEQQVGRINGEFAEPGYLAVHYLYRSLPFDELVAYYRTADTAVVTPLRDGMNLVAKEYVASRIDGDGCLILSEFAGAAHEMSSDAIMVNPHDIDGLSSSFEMALSMDPKALRKKMAGLRRALARNDVYSWADSFLGALAG